MGITLSGSTVVIYDDNDATNHANAPNPHLDAEISAFAAATFTDLGTSPKNYHQQLSIQLGANGGQVTTWSVNDDSITILAGKNISAFASAASVTYVKFGTKVGSGSVSSGKRGPKIRGGSAVNLSCNCEIYGATIESETGPVSLANNALCTICDIKNSLIKAATVVQLGAAGASPFPDLYNVDFMSDTTVATVVTNFFPRRAEKVTFTATNPVGFILWNLNVAPAIRDAKFFGTPSSADVRMTSGPTLPLQLVTVARPPWSGNGPRFPNSSFMPDGVLGLYAQEWGVVDISTQNRLTGERLAGIEARATDRFGRVIFDWTPSDANGEITFGDDVNTIFGNAIEVLDYYRDPLATYGYNWIDRSPITFEFRDPAGNFIADRLVLGWPMGADQYGPLLRPMSAELQLVPKGVINWREMNTDVAA